MSTVPQLSDNRCEICAQTLEPGADCRNSICRQDKATRGFGRIAAISRYSDPLDRVLKGFKYDDDPRWAAWAPILGRLIYGWLEANARTAKRYDVIVPNPTTADRKPRRHTELILKAARREDVRRRWPLRTTLLVKTEATPKSAGNSLSDKRSAAQLHADAIELQADFTDANVLLFDDIFTSGSQMSAVAHKLLDGGAPRVDGLVLARAIW